MIFFFSSVNGLGIPACKIVTVLPDISDLFVKDALLIKHLCETIIIIIIRNKCFLFCNKSERSAVVCVNCEENAVVLPLHFKFELNHLTVWFNLKISVKIPKYLLCYLIWTISNYRSGMVNSKSFVGKVLLRIKWKFELN